MSLKAQAFYAFGPFRLEPSERVLLRDGTPVPLPPRAFDLLVVLVERAGRLVTKDDLFKEVWQDTFVEETNLTYTVSLLRKALGDDAEPHEYIETVAKRGYRFKNSVRQGGGEESAGESTQRRSPIWVAASVVLLLLLGFASWLVFHAREPDPPTLARLALMPPPGVTVENAQISPDGQRIAFVGREGDAGKVWQVSTRLWFQPLGATEASPLQGTEGAINPFWAPDSQHVAFFADSKLKTIDLSGGPPQTLGPAIPYAGGSWSRSGAIVYHIGPGTELPLYQIPSSGGTLKPVTKVDASKKEQHLWPYFLPDGRHFLYVAHTEKERSGLYVGSLDSTDSKRLLDVETPAIYGQPGYLLYSRDGEIVARPFDPARLEFKGAATPIAYDREFSARVGEPQFLPASRSVRGLGLWFYFSVFGTAIFSASDNGSLVYSLFEPYQQKFSWFDRSGNVLGDVGGPGVFSTFDLSSDGRRVVAARAKNDAINLWLLDLERGTPSQITFGSALELDPRWGPDGRIAMTSYKDGERRVVVLGVDGKRTVVVDQPAYLDDWSRDGRFLLCRRSNDPATPFFVLPLFGQGKPIDVDPAKRGGDQSSFAPDGRLFAYHDGRSGRFEVYAERFPPTGEVIQISSDGGLQPVWRQDGRELFYLGLDGNLYAVEIDEARLKAGRPRPLFKAPVGPLQNAVEQYATVDGKRFLFLRPIDRHPRPINVVINWPAVIKDSSRH